jgi:hypothetical protein
MRRLKWLGVLILLLLVEQASFADDRDKLLGIWKLVSWEKETIATGQRKLFFGKSPSGYLIFTPEGRMMLIITGEGRLGLNTNQNCTELFSSMYSYTGTYQVQGDKWITKIDVASNPGFVGENAIRSFKVDGDRLQAIGGSGRTEKDIFTWERAKD